MEKILNLEYAGIQGTYWMVYGAICSFASVFLLANDFSNSGIGIVFAVGSILAVVIQPFLADIADRAKRISIIVILEIMAATMILLTAGMFVFKGTSLALAVIFILLIAWHTVLQPLINTLSFKLGESGYRVNFGLTRSFGSLAYALLVALLGTLVERHGIGLIPITTVLLLAAFMLCLLATKVRFGKACEANREEYLKRKERVKGEITLADFIRRNKVFFVVSTGVVGLYFSNSVFNNFMMQIVADVGGTSEDMGRILGVMAALEIPTLVFFSYINKRFSCRTLIKVASIGFFIKIAIAYFAPNVTWLFVSQFMQPFSFALFLPAMVHYIDEIMDKGEAVKGQALFVTMITIGSVFASLVGGVIIDMNGVKTLLLVSSALTLLGGVVIISFIGKIKNEQHS